MNHLLISPQELEGEKIVIEGDPYRHLFRALRLECGDPLRLIDGHGRARFGRVVEVDRRTAIIALEGPADANEPRLEVTLAVAPPKPERARWMVEKATEIGVRRVLFFGSSRSPRRFGKTTLERFRRVARSAVEQCGRAREPEIAAVRPFDELLDLLRGAPMSRLLDPRAETPAASGPTPRSVVLVVGPEGGFSRSEFGELVECGAEPMGLGARILRTETAAIVGLASLLTSGRVG